MAKYAKDLKEKPMPITSMNVLRDISISSGGLNSTA